MPILLAVITFLLTGFVANWLVQNWQYRNWINQQRFLGAEKRFEALRTHAENLAKLASTRLSSMFRLTYAVNMAPEFMEERRKIYSSAVDEWNGNINLIYAKTTMYTRFGLTKRIEDEIHDPFVAAGSAIERAIRAKIANPAKHIDLVPILNQLNGIQGRLENLNRDMLRIVISRQAATYQGVEVSYKKSSLKYLSTWQLFQALFITRVDDFRVTLTSFQLEPPASDLD